jgi:hypothetical protein
MEYFCVVIERPLKADICIGCFCCTFGNCSNSMAIYKISLSIIFYFPYCCTSQHIFKFSVQYYQKHSFNIQVSCRCFWLCQDQPVKLYSNVLQHTGRFFLQNNFKLTHELCFICPSIFIPHNPLSIFYPLYCTSEGSFITSLILPVKYTMNIGH